MSSATRSSAQASKAKKRELEKSDEDKHGGSGGNNKTNKDENIMDETDAHGPPGGGPPGILRPRKPPGEVTPNPTAGSASRSEAAEDASMDAEEEAEPNAATANSSGSGSLNNVFERAKIFSQAAATGAPPAAPAAGNKVQTKLNMNVKPKLHEKETFLYFSITLEQTDMPSKIIRDNCGKMFSALVSHDKIINVVVRKPVRGGKDKYGRKLKHISSAAMVPECHDTLLKYVSFINEPADFSKPIKGRKGKVFQGVFSIGTVEGITDDDMSALFIDLSEQGYSIEVKRYQCEHSVKALLAGNVSGDIPLTEMQRLGQRALQTAIREGSAAKSPLQRGLLNAAIDKGEYNTLVAFEYPPNNFQRHVEGQAFVETKCKQVMSFEISTAIQKEVIGVMTHFKTALRAEGLGCSTVLVVPKGKEDKQASVKRYKDMLAISVGHNKLLSTIELRNVRTIEENFEIVLDSGNVTKNLKTILLEAKTRKGASIFSSVYDTGEGEFAASYYNLGDREAGANNVAKHVASWVLYHLIFEYGAGNEANVENIMKQHFHGSQRTVAYTHSNYNSNTGIVTIHQEQQDLMQDDSEFLDLQQEAWFDLSFLSPAVVHGNTAAAALFNPDAGSAGSMNTTQYMAHEYGAGGNVKSILDQVRLNGESEETASDGGNVEHVDMETNEQNEEQDVVPPQQRDSASGNSAQHSYSTAPQAAGSTGFPPPGQEPVVEDSE